MSDMLMYVVSCVMQLPVEWIPENKASLLMFMGVRVTRLGIAFNCEFKL